MFCLKATAKEKRQRAGAEGWVKQPYTAWRYENVILELHITHGSLTPFKKQVTWLYVYGNSSSGACFSARSIIYSSDCWTVLIPFCPYLFISFHNNSTHSYSRFHWFSDSAIFLSCNHPCLKEYSYGWLARSENTVSEWFIKRTDTICFCKLHVVQQKSYLLCWTSNHSFDLATYFFLQFHVISAMIDFRP